MLPGGSGGRVTMTTCTPRSRAAVSFAAVMGPPLFFVTSRPIPCSRISADSRPTVYGPRSRISVMRGGTGPSGGSTARTRNSCRSSAANVARSRRPVVRKTLSPGQARTVSAAARMSATLSHSGSASQPGRRRTSSGTPASAAARAAFAVIAPANGWVASITRVIPSARRNAASPSTPPNPPTRTGPSGRRGWRTRPASEETTSVPAATSAAASSLASPVPPRMRMRTGTG